MNNWIKFDAEKPETWVRGKQMLVKADNGEEWLGQFAQGRGVFFLKGCRGDVLLPEHITHYMTPTNPTKPSDHVSVPREFIREAFDHIREWDSGMSEWLNRARQYVTHFQDQSPETKDRE